MVSFSDLNRAIMGLPNKFQQGVADAQALVNELDLIKKGKQAVQEGFDAIYPKAKEIVKGPSSLNKVNATKQVGNFKFNQLSPTGKVMEALKTPLTKANMGMISKGLAPLGSIAGVAGRYSIPIAQWANLIQGARSGRYDSDDVLGHAGGAVLGTAGAMAPSVAPILQGAGLALDAFTGWKKGEKEGYNKLDPAKLARGEYAPDAKTGFYASLLKEPEYAKILQEQGLGALYDVLYPDLKDYKATGDEGQQQDYSGFYLTNQYGGGGNNNGTTLPTLPQFLQTDGLGYQYKGDNQALGQILSALNPTGVNGQSGLSEGDLQLLALMAGAEGEGQGNQQTSTEQPPELRPKENIVDPTQQALLNTLDKLNERLDKAGDKKRDPVRDAWISQMWGLSPTQVFGYPQSETEQLINLQKSLANQLKIYDTLTSMSRDKEQQQALQDAITSGKLGSGVMGMMPYFLANDKTANEAFKYLASLSPEQQALDEQKLNRELQKVGFTQGLIGRNQLLNTLFQGENTLRNTFAQGQNTRANTNLNNYLQFIRAMGVQDRIDRRQDASTQFKQFLYNQGLIGRGGSSNEITPYQQAQLFLKMAELDPENFEDYIGMAGQLLPQGNKTTSTPSGSGRIKSVAGLYN